jgi:hypothetical protein
MADEMTIEKAQANPRFYLDRRIPGGYQTPRDGIDKEAHDAWVESNTWGLTRDDIIALGYFHGSIENGSDGSASDENPINGFNDYPDDVVYVSARGGCLTRAMAHDWFVNSNAFIHGYTACANKHAYGVTASARDLSKKRRLGNVEAACGVNSDGGKSQ